MENDVVEDLKELMGTGAATEPPAETPDPKPEATPPEVDPTPEPAAETPPAKEAAQTPEPEKVPETWNKALAKTQKDLAIERQAREEDRKVLARTQKLLEKLATHAGVEADPEPPAPPEPSAEHARITKLERELEFMKLARKNPEIDPEKLDDEAWDEALEFFDIPKDARELPAGITADALTKARDKIFHRKVEALSQKPKAPVQATATPAPRPVPTPAGKRVTPVPVSPVPSRRQDPNDFLKDCRDLVGG